MRLLQLAVSIQPRTVSIMVAFHMSHQKSPSSKASKVQRVCCQLMHVPELNTTNNRYARKQHGGLSHMVRTRLKPRTGPKQACNRALSNTGCILSCGLYSVSETLLNHKNISASNDEVPTYCSTWRNHAQSKFFFLDILAGNR